ncbi:MAG: hypothetical protein ACO2OW_02290 [Minisyncoccia bacterium]
MKKVLFASIIFIFFFAFNFAFSQKIEVDPNTLRQVINILQSLLRKSETQFETSSEPLRNEIENQEIEKKMEKTPEFPEIKIIQPQKLEIPKGVKPSLPKDIETKPITPEIIKPILPDEDRSNDVIVQINNLRITRILLDPGIENVKAIFFAVRDIGWKCLLFESEESKKSLPCILDIRRKVLQRELAIQITDDTILLLRNRQRAKLEDFQVGDKINVYGFMDKDNNAIDALIVRKVASFPKPIFQPIPKPIEPKLPVTSTPRVCIQVITPAYNPQNPLECKEFPTPCDVPPGWIKTEKCPVRTPKLQTPTTQTQTTVEAKVEADDYSFYPSSLEFTKGAKVKLYLYVRSSNVYYGGLDFRSEKFKTEPVRPGQNTEVEFIADKDFIIESYWPLSNVKKAELKVIVK